MYKCKYFRIEELVSQSEFEKYKDNQNVLWWEFDRNILYIADRLRDDYGVLTINDWLWGGKNHCRGLRLPDCNVGAERSQHRFGRALDIIPRNISPDEIREDILNHKRCYMEKITAIEMNISWLHIDVRNNKGRILKFYPNG